MPRSTNSSNFETAWINFVKSAQILLVPQADDRPLDQYLEFRNTVLELVQSRNFLGTFGNYPFNQNPFKKDIGDALILELRAFPLAMEIAKATSKPEDSKKWWKKMLGQASTVTGSVKDLLDDLPSEAKMVLTLFKELIDLFKG